MQFITRQAHLFLHTAEQCTNAQTGLHVGQIESRNWLVKTAHNGLGCIDPKLEEQNFHRYSEVDLISTNTFSLNRSMAI